MARREVTGRKPGVSADLIERESGPPAEGNVSADLVERESGRPAAATVRPESFDDADAFSVEEFCWRHRISVQVFYKYPDLMPDSFYVGSRRLISREAAARWRATREAEAARKPGEDPQPMKDLSHQNYHCKIGARQAGNDLASVWATALQQIYDDLASDPEQRRKAIEDYLRDEIAALTQQIAADRRV